jgi:hypothetical protein
LDTFEINKEHPLSSQYIPGTQKHSLISTGLWETRNERVYLAASRFNPEFNPLPASVLDLRGRAGADHRPDSCSIPTLHSDISYLEQPISITQLRIELVVACVYFQLNYEGQAQTIHY